MLLMRSTITNCVLSSGLTTLTRSWLRPTSTHLLAVVLAGAPPAARIKRSGWLIVIELLGDRLLTKIGGRPPVRILRICVMAVMALMTVGRSCALGIEGSLMPACAAGAW